MRKIIVRCGVDPVAIHAADFIDRNVSSIWTSEVVNFSSDHLVQLSFNAAVSYFTPAEDKQSQVLRNNVI